MTAQPPRSHTFKNCLISLAMIASMWLGDGAVVAASSAMEAVRGTTSEVIEILSNEDLKGPEHLVTRRRLLEDAIGSRFDYEEMSKRTLAAQWKRLARSEQLEFVELLKEFLSARYADKLETYSDEQVRYLDEHLLDHFAEVRTIVASSKTEIPMDYRLLKKSGKWFVYDVVVDGVSLVSNYRGQFKTIIRDSSYRGLVRKLKDQIEANAEGPIPNRS